MSQEKQVIKLHDLEPKQKFEGTVTRLELYGAFVDFGAEKEGLVHISQVSETRINKITDALSEGDSISVWIQEVDADQGRIGLTMIEPPERTMDDLKPDMIVTGKVTKLAPYGAFVDIGVGRDGLVHISEMAEGRIGQPSDVVKEGEEIRVRIVKVNRQKRQIELSLQGLDPVVQVPDDDEQEEETMTAMELAWRNAMESQGHSLKVATRHKGRRRKKDEIRRQQAAIIARTLGTKAE
ncbi:MAG: S1 RNA-binding domain-containing protein [Anaerolineae bacterium]|nr:S1 RNA-binding domain-containing protein [Anaerolineae bacterium]